MQFFEWSLMFVYFNFDSKSNNVILLASLAAVHMAATFSPTD